MADVYFGPSTQRADSFFKNDSTNGRLQTQQPILYSAQVPPDLGSWRREILENDTIDDAHKIGKTLTTGHGDAFDLLHLMPLDPAFYFNFQSKTLPTDVYHESRVQVFQSFNGFQIPENVRTQEQFEEMFIYAGQPMRAFHFGKMGQMPTGVAMLVAGSKNMWNYGKDVWFPGDKLCWRLPSIDREVRDEEVKSLPYDREHPALRYRAIIEVLSFEKSHNFLRDAITRSFDTTRSGTYSFLRTVPGADDTLSSIERAVIAFRSVFQLHSFHTIAVLLAYGLDPSRVPGDGVLALDYANYRANAGLEALDLDGVLFKQAAPRADLVGANHPPQAEMQPDDKKRFANKVLYWAAKCGLLGRSVPEHVQPFQNFIDVTLGLTLRPLLTNKEMHNYFSDSRLFPESMLRGSTVKAANSMAQQFDLGHPIGSLLYGQTSFAKDVFASIGYAVEHQMNKVMCTSLSMTAPKQWGDTWA